MDFEIRKLKMGLISYLDKVDLPAEVKRMVLKEVYENAERKSEESIRRMLEAESELVPVRFDCAAKKDEEGKLDE